VSFWIFLINSGKSGGWKTIFHKGDFQKEQTPTLMIWPNQLKLHLRVSTDFDWNEDLDSMSVLVS
jgi:hypothetical protein